MTFCKDCGTYTDAISQETAKKLESEASSSRAWARQKDCEVISKENLLASIRYMSDETSELPDTMYNLDECANTFMECMEMFLPTAFVAASDYNVCAKYGLTCTPEEHIYMHSQPKKKVDSVRRRSAEEDEEEHWARKFVWTYDEEAEKWNCDEEWIQKPYRGDAWTLVKEDGSCAYHPDRDP